MCELDNLQDEIEATCIHDFKLTDIVEDEYYYRCTLCGFTDIS